MPNSKASHLIHATGAHPRDVRMTTRFKSHDLSEGLTGAIHETGHALYEQARNMKYDGLPVNEVGLTSWQLHKIEGVAIAGNLNLLSWSCLLEVS